MTSKSFFIRLAAISAGTALLLAMLYALLPQMQEHGPFALLSIILFSLVCTGLFFSGRSAAHSSSKVAFTNLVSASVFGKMVLAIAVLFVYQQAAEPSNQWFVGVFILVYVVYTVFEVWFMTKLAHI